MILHRISLSIFYYLFIFAYLYFNTAQSKLNNVTIDDSRFLGGFFGSNHGPINGSVSGGKYNGPNDNDNDDDDDDDDNDDNDDNDDEKKSKKFTQDGSEDVVEATTPPADENDSTDEAIMSKEEKPVEGEPVSPPANLGLTEGIEVRFVPSGSDDLNEESAPLEASDIAEKSSHMSNTDHNDNTNGDDNDNNDDDSHDDNNNDDNNNDDNNDDDSDDDDDDDDNDDNDEAKNANHQDITIIPPMTMNLPLLAFTNKQTTQGKMNANDSFRNLYNLYHKTSPQIGNVNYFRKELQNEFAFKNGIYFSATSVKEYNQRVDPNKHAYIKLPENTMVLVVTGNKFFFQDLVYSKNKYSAIKKKFSFLMNSMISSLKKKYFFKNYEYQYLYKDDSFAHDHTKRLLDMELLGQLSKVTQTICVDEEKKKNVSMHKVYGGWFDFLGILVVNGYNMKPNESDQMKEHKGSIDVVPEHMLTEFRELVMKRHDGYENGYAVGLWRDFPNDKFVPWRYSVELFLWDLLNVLPHELPHPANLMMTYTGNGKTEEADTNSKVVNEMTEEENQKLYNSVNQTEKPSREQILNWHEIIQNKISSYPGFEVKIVAVNDYMHAIGYSNEIFARYYNAKNGNAYIFLILINRDFFVDEFVQKASNHDEYVQEKNKYFTKKMNEVLEDLEKRLEQLKEELFPEDERTKPVITFYNYLADEKNYEKLNPHILGEIAGITKHLKCDQLGNHNNGLRCSKDISLHYKYGGWFEFAGAISVKNVNFVPTKYEKHGEILEKKYENAILTQANSNFQDAWLWKDLPERNMNPYRYSLHVFTLEKPQFNILKLKEMHPFIVVDILNKGLQAVKVQSQRQKNTIVEDEEGEVVRNNDDSTSYYHDNGNSFSSGSQTNFNYIAKDYMKKDYWDDVEGSSQMSTTVSTNVDGDKETSEDIDQNEYITENVESGGSSDAEEEEYTEDKYNEEEEIDDGEYVEVNEGLSSKTATQPQPQVQYETEANTSQETLKNNNTVRTEENNTPYDKYEGSILFRDIANNYGDNEKDGRSKIDGSDVLKAGHFSLSGGLQAMTDLVSKHLGSGKRRDVKRNNDMYNVVSRDNNDDDDNGVDDIYNEVSKNRKKDDDGDDDDDDDDDDEDDDDDDDDDGDNGEGNGLTTSKYLQNHKFGAHIPTDFKSKVYLFIIVCLVFICIALVVTIAIRLYDILVKRKIVDMNRTVLSFKDREDIPVVQGIPAPWMNA
ncbi:conserved Plasmodium protein, unknown function [Plasmodium knowlesi strain H]|uniref:Exported protein 3 n=3 Tax=Plasmodium knowlesi TaxID=5850 RepID=A0A5K1TV79_PLAKH|nr:exported protein 3, putative [Plasmodium knowlesi strain H]OTN68358.1 Uncharacterized protein PKNOH_S03324100 [Plasmodium knowlesi]CAA9987143.1 exported protein 3, putative [Plasmodium knowlesi strain H]SBO23896.1 conserved Plasmodium protein, unknown function [Plasmodium knowlesi strain H]SBO25745.1 conserved Plasmodium protein, unknown function [Plasmodium knowlesi strain H]VVS76617.1 exported protein 3, putative [Plasmodium knowlesi strain H]|eukprot:XP_002261765.1 hypothetical protein, conserved in Plasmodium species [Plasmodium knowlesi strain H]